jgi:hypothetical protein
LQAIRRALYAKSSLPWIQTNKVSRNKLSLESERKWAIDKHS